jgi:hypothetical protein
LRLIEWHTGSEGAQANLKRTQQTVVSAGIIEINPMPLTQAARDDAMFQAGRYDKDGPFGLFGSSIQGKCDFFVKESDSVDGAAG